MNELAAFGLFAVTAMLVCYALEDHSRWFILAFAGSYAQGAWPFGIVKAIWWWLPAEDGGSSGEGKAVAAEQQPDRLHFVGR